VAVPDRLAVGLGRVLEREPQQLADADDRHAGGHLGVEPPGGHVRPDLDLPGVGVSDVPGVHGEHVGERLSGAGLAQPGEHRPLGGGRLGGIRAGLSTEDEAGGGDQLDDHVPLLLRRGAVQDQRDRAAGRRDEPRRPHLVVERAELELAAHLDAGLDLPPGAAAAQPGPVGRGPGVVEVAQGGGELPGARRSVHGLAR
jgi:hypothetical protein